MHECVLSYHAIDGTGIFSQQGLIFLENDKNWFSVVFTVSPKHIKIKSSLKYTSVCGRVVKPSALSTVLSSYNCSIRGSGLDGARFAHHFFPIILNQCNVSQLFIADLLYFIISYYTSSFSH